MKVLIVEDEEVSQKVLRVLLSSHGYQTDAVGSAEQAEEAMRLRGDFDVVLVDVDLPGKDGLELLEQLRESRSHAKPVLVTSADADRVAPARQRGVPYLQKPLDFRKLLHILGTISENN